MEPGEDVAAFSRRLGIPEAAVIEANGGRPAKEWISLLQWAQLSSQQNSGLPQYLTRSGAADRHESMESCHCQTSGSALTANTCEQHALQCKPKYWCLDSLKVELYSHLGAGNLSYMGWPMFKVTTLLCMPWCHCTHWCCLQAALTCSLAL